MKVTLHSVKLLWKVNLRRRHIISEFSLMQGRRAGYGCNRKRKTLVPRRTRAECAAIQGHTGATTVEAAVSES